MSASPSHSTLRITLRWMVKPWRESPDPTEAVLFSFFVLSSNAKWICLTSHQDTPASYGFPEKLLEFKGRFNEPVNPSQLRVYSVSAVYLKPNERPAAPSWLHITTTQDSAFSHNSEECCTSSFLCKNTLYFCQRDSLVTVGRWFGRLVSFGHAVQQSVKMCTFLSSENSASTGGDVVNSTETCRLLWRAKSRVRW